MKLAASQIAWLPRDEPRALEILCRAGFVGLEIAPTLAVGQDPYSRPAAAACYAKQAREAYGLAVCSMQSIWYGQEGSLFGPRRQALLSYTQKALLFAQAAGCGNLVFGCPKNRVLPAGQNGDEAVPFLRQVGAFAVRCNTVFSIEPLPKTYGTNFINSTQEAFALAARVASPGIMVNLDVGGMLENGEDTRNLCGRVGAIRHVHISAPQLAPPMPHPLHGELAALLREEGYGGYVSIEMRTASLAVFEETAHYVAEVFG